MMSHNNVFRAHIKAACRKFCSYSGASEDQKLLESCRVLGLKPGADQEQVRSAFLALCKIHHPDSAKSQVDTEKFHEIEKAYRHIQSTFIKQRWDTADEDINKSNEPIADFDIKHTAPQHRTYLSYDGVGMGSPSVREQQYQQHRAQQAATAVMEHRIQQAQPQSECALTHADKARVKKTKTGLGMDRLIEDLIQESMARGDFDNLRGAGRPLPNENYNPHVDFITHKMNEIMIDNGFTPEWISLAKEIEDDIKVIRKLLEEKCNLDNDQIKAEINPHASSLNKKIQLYNLIVPILNRQKLLYSIDNDLEKIRISLRSKQQNLSENKSTEPACDNPTLLETIYSLFTRRS